MLSYYPTVPTIEVIYPTSGRISPPEANFGTVGTVGSRGRLGPQTTHHSDCQAIFGPLAKLGKTEFCRVCHVCFACRCIACLPAATAQAHSRRLSQPRSHSLRLSPCVPCVPVWINPFIPSIITCFSPVRGMYRRKYIHKILFSVGEKTP